ncbi:MAG: tRNA (guanosine(37)-N1)-methyltransferase TrmD [Eubacterium sp.]|nr:tRNA (guanosine(37)-N1)-methyltransferase TrmD [Eubacterium sp.]
MIRIDIATLFPEMCEAVLSESIIGRARKAGHIEVHCHNIRDYANNKHNRVDDKPYGGGTGMVMQAQPIYDCISNIRAETGTDTKVIYMSPQGKPLTQQKVKELAALDGFIILCGHYEGVDCRVIEELDAEEISVGDYVVTGGELPALILADAAARLQEGVLPNSDAYSLESHYERLLEYPQYTRPEVWKDRKVPEVLLSGDHKNVEEWQRQMSVTVTREKRPDLLTSRRNDGTPYAKYIRFAVCAEGFPAEIGKAVLLLSKRKELSSAEKKTFVKIAQYLDGVLPSDTDGKILWIMSNAQEIIDMMLTLGDILTAHKVRFNIVYSTFTGEIIRQGDVYLLTET